MKLLSVGLPESGCTPYETCILMWFGIKNVEPMATIIKFWIRTSWKFDRADNTFLLVRQKDDCFRKLGSLVFQLVPLPR